MRAEIQQLIDSNDIDLAKVQVVFATSPLNAGLEEGAEPKATIKEIEWPTQIEIVACYGGSTFSSAYDKFVDGNDEASDYAWERQRSNAFVGHLHDLARAEQGL